MGYRDDNDKKPSHLEMVTVQAMAGTVAGACSSIITTPMDTIKTRLQVCSVSYYHSLFLLHYYVHRRRNYLFFFRSNLVLFGTLCYIWSNSEHENSYLEGYG